MHKLFPLAAAVAALALVACGGDDDSDEAASVTPQQAISEITQVRAGLDRSLAAYEDGDTAQAATLAEDAYLEHFELVEGPLEEADEELNEELEEQIREELPDAIKGGDPTALYREIDEGLDEAEQTLRAEG